MPLEMQSLLRDYPREAWPDHPNFAQSIQNWLGAHTMFRQLGNISRANCEGFLDKSRSADDFAARLSHYGGLLVNNLHGHHTWEDRSYFPELRKADDRFDIGLEILEKDHQRLDGVLTRFIESGNRTIKLVNLDEAQAYDEAGVVLEATQEIEALLAQHLREEEELVVPILLHHKMRG
jgi:hemerythrin HHE cation binding domain-containing protein